MTRLRATAWRPLLRVALIALLTVVAACSSANQADPPAPGETRGVRWDDGRVAFRYPEGWEVVEEGGAAEYGIRIEPPGARDENPDIPASAIVLFWPFVGQQSLEAVANHWGADADDPVVTDVEEQDIDLPGASEALRQDYRVLDASDDLREDPVQYRTVLAMGEAGRSLVVMVAAAEASDVDVDEVADLVLGTMELSPAWP